MQALSRENANFLQFERHKQRLSFTRKNIIPKIRGCDPKKAEIMETCSQFIYACDCTTCKARHFAGSHKCRSRFCLECAHHRSMAYVARMMQRIVPLVDEGYMLHMLTFTIRDQDDLADQVEKLKRAWRVISHGRGTREKFKQRLVGGFRTFELKIGEGSGKWHAHMHALFLTPPGKFEKDYDWLQPAWKNATCGDGSIEIHRVRQRKGQAAGIIKAVIECAKYVTSPDKVTINLDEERFREMYIFMKGFRAVNSWGKLRGLVKECEDEADKNMTWDEKKLADFVCRLCGSDEAQFKVLFAKALENSYLLDL